MTTRLTVLNMMASSDFDESIRTHVRWGLEWMDLWGDIYGCPSVDLLTEPTAQRAAAAIERAGLRVYCLSTRIFNGHVEVGEEEFRAEHLGQLARSLEVASIVKPTMVRLIAARLTKPVRSANSIGLLKADHPWVADVYREAVRMIVDAGFAATVENESTECILSSAQEFIDFFDWLGMGDKLSLTWDVQNNWQMGVFPSLDQYHRLKHLIRYVHLKGGQSKPGTDQLGWSVGLADASWPVHRIAQAVVEDHVSPVICLNPSHGSRKPGYDYGLQTSPEDVRAVTERDLEFLRTRVKGIAS